MQFGLVGTGPWASSVHGPALAGSEDADLVGVWGRSPDKAVALAAALGVHAFPDLDTMLDQVDAVAFAVPPGVQPELALRAARAGRHLLLDKPVAVDTARAQALAEEVDARGLASIVFFTHRFSAAGARWLDDVRGGGWSGGDVQWLAALTAPGNPYASSAWRHERGALWDIGPHVLSTLIGALGPISRIIGVSGARDLVHLVMAHSSGATSTATMTLFAPEAAERHEVRVWGERGVSQMPTRSDGGAVAAFTRAVAALAESARTGAPHPADLRLGVEVVALLETVEQQLRGHSEGQDFIATPSRQ